MKTSLKLSAIALLTTAMTALPVQALSLNLGGDAPLVDLGNDNNADATLSLDTGTLLGGSGDNGVDASAGVQLNLNDAGGELLGSDGVLGGNALIDLGGNDDVDATVDLDLGGGILDLGGGTGDLLDLGSAGDLLDLGEGNLLDLNGRQELVALDLRGTDVNAGLNLERAGQPLLDVTIGTGADGVAGTGILPGTDASATLGGGNVAAVSLSGSGDDGAGGGNGNGGSGNDGGAGNGAGGGAGNGSGGDGDGSGNGGSGTGILTGGTTDAAACLTLNATQLEQLIQRHAYTRATFNSWASARQLKIVAVDFCDRVAAEVAAAADGSSNVERLQAFLAAQAKVRAGLASKGYSAGDVIAADHSGDVLIVYVI